MEMRVAWHRPVEVPARLVEQRPRQAGRALQRPLRVLADVHGHVRRHLVVARAHGMKLSSHRAGDFRHATLEGHVDVLVILGEQKRAIRQLPFDLLQRLVKGVAILG